MWLVVKGAIMLKIIQRFDWSVMRWIQKTLKCDALDFIMPKVTQLGTGGAVWLFAAVLMLMSTRYQEYGVAMLAALASGVLVGNIFLKNMVGRHRPCWLDEAIALLVKNPKDYSFPSCHTLASVIAAVVLTSANPRFGLIAIPLAAIIAFSRLYLYVHFPSDVLASIALGLFLGFFMMSMVLTLYSVSAQ